MKKHSKTKEVQSKKLVGELRLARELARRDIANRYAGSILGALWPFLNPLFLLVIYTVVFGKIMNVRWPSGTGSQTEFALLLFIGLILFNFFSECITRAPTIIISNTNFVKKVIFPLHTLPISLFFTALFQGGTSLAVWFTGHLLFFGLPTLTALLIIPYLIPFFAMTCGFILILASFGVFFRDFNQLMSLSTTALLFLSPIFFPLETISQPLRTILLFNPLTIPVIHARELLFFGTVPPVMELIIYSFFSIIVLGLGHLTYSMLRSRFADVL